MKRYLIGIIKCLRGFDRYIFLKLKIVQARPRSLEKGVRDFFDFHVLGAILCNLQLIKIALLDCHRYTTYGYICLLVEVIFFTDALPHISIKYFFYVRVTLLHQCVAFIDNNLRLHQS